MVGLARACFAKASTAAGDNDPMVVQIAMKTSEAR